MSDNIKERQSLLNVRSVEMQEKILLLTQMARRYRLETFEMIYRRGNGHWGGSSSCVEILTVLYFHTELSTLILQVSISQRYGNI